MPGSSLIKSATADALAEDKIPITLKTIAKSNGHIIIVAGYRNALGVPFIEFLTFRSVGRKDALISAKPDSKESCDANLIRILSSTSSIFARPTPFFLSEVKFKSLELLLNALCVTFILREVCKA